VFEGHPDLRRILTDYGFVGHPFARTSRFQATWRMRYDPEQKRVIYHTGHDRNQREVNARDREDSYAKP